VPEEGEGLGPQWHRPAVAAQLPGAQVELERREVDDHRGHMVCMGFVTSTAQCTSQEARLQSRRLREIYEKSPGFLRTSERRRRKVLVMQGKQMRDRVTEVPLPPDRAFVVQLRQQPDPGAELFVGRVEHIASGEFVRFGSAAELIAFMAKIGGSTHP
jgi:hypothetical protein